MNQEFRCLEGDRVVAAVRDAEIARLSWGTGVVELPVSDGGVSFPAEVRDDCEDLLEGAACRGTEYILSLADGDDREIVQYKLKVFHDPAGGTLGHQRVDMRLAADG